MPVNTGSVTRVGRHFASALGGPIVETSVPGAANRAFTRTSVVTPFYRRDTLMRKPKRYLDLPMNPFDFILIEGLGKEGLRWGRRYRKSDGVQLTDNQDWGDWSPNGGTLAEDAAVWSRLESEAIGKMLNGLKDQSINLGVAIGEGRQTANLFVDTAKRIAGAGRELKRGNFNGAAFYLTGVNSSRNDNLNYQKQWKKDAPLAFANGWLQLQYGWKPLLSDIHGAMQFLANKLYRVPRYKTSSGANKMITTHSYGQLFAPPSPYALDTNATQTYQVSYVLYYTGSENHSPSSLGLINPLSIAWELVPWSFAIDWMLPIGNYLNNLDATVGLNFVKGCKTRFYTGITTQAEVGNSFETPTERHVNLSTVKQVNKYVHCTRTKLLSFPSAPIPRLKPPFGNAKWEERVGNACALLYQVFKGPGTKGPFNPGGGFNHRL